MAYEPTDEEIDAGIRRGEEFRRNNVAASSVTFDRSSGIMTISFVDGTEFFVDPRRLQDLENATEDDLAAVEIERDYNLRWDALDVDYTIPGLKEGRFGSEAYMRRRREAEEAAS